MELIWGDGFDEGDTQGLDVLGVRRLDQNLEAALVNGITTISIRGRYFTVLPWALGEFFAAEAAASASVFDDRRFRTFLSRVEFLVLACTALDVGEGDPGGALGSVTFQQEISRLIRNEPVPFPKDRNGSMLGTYFGPCRAFGLLRTAEPGHVVPFALTPRGKRVWEARQTTMGDSPWRTLVWEAETLDPQDARNLIPHFSLKQLAPADAEALAFREAILTPWSPSGPTAVSVAKSYERFGQTIEWLKATRNNMPLRADALLTDAWRRAAIGGNHDFPVEQAWAEYEWRRRLHFALELLLSATSEAIRERRQAILAEIVEEWSEELELPPKLISAWPEALDAWRRTGSQAVESVPSDLYLGELLPSDLGKLRPHARALIAFALVAALARQSAGLRENKQFQNFGAAGERALACIESAANSDFSDTLRALASVVVQAHLSTTFRKMGGGQKCSLRFFPEGSKLLTTDTDTGAGQSGTRLWNVIRVLQDAAVPGIGVQ